MRHTLSILVENRFGELARIVGLFSARGYNIESLTVAETLDPQMSRVTLVTRGDDRTIEQITKQVNKQVRVLSVTDLTVRDHIERELVLVHLNAESATARQKVLTLVDSFEARIIGGSDNYLTVEATGERSQVEALLRSLGADEIREMVSATVAIETLPGPAQIRKRTRN